MMNLRAGTLVAVNRLGGPPKLPRSLADLFCLIAATSKVGGGVCARSTATTATTKAVRVAAWRCMQAILVGLRPFGAVDDQDVHAVARRFELETELLAKRLENRRSV